MDLQAQNAALRKDITEMVDMMNKLREENETYRQNFENLREAHTTLTQQAGMLGKQASEATESARVSALHHEQLLLSLKGQLDAKSREFDDLRERMLPTRELDMIRIRIAEELDGPHRAHTAQLEGEIEKFRGLYYSLRRDYELLKANLDAQQNESRDAAAEANAKYEADIQSLTIRLAQQQQVIDDRSDVNRHKGLVREVTELQQRLRQALVEIDDVRAEYEKVKSDMIKIERTHARQLSDEQGARRSIMAEKDAISTKCANLEGLVADLQRQNRIFTEQLTQLDFSKSDSQAQLDDTVADYRRQTDELRRALEDVESSSRRERDNLSRNLEDVTKQLQEAKQKERELSVQLALYTKDFTSRLKKAREEDSAIVRAAEQAVAKKEEELAAAERSHIAILTKLDLEVQEKHTSLIETAAQLKAAEAEVKSLTDKVRMQQVTLDERSADVTANAKLVESLQASNKEISRNLSDSTRQEQMLRSTVDRLTNDKARISGEMEANVRSAVAEISTKYQRAVDHEREKSLKIQALVKKLKKYKVEYQQMKSRYERVTAALQRQAEILTTKLDRVTMEKEAGHHNLNTEIIRLRSQINSKMRDQGAQLHPNISGSLSNMNNSSIHTSNETHPSLHLLEEQDRLTRAELLSLNSHLSTLQQYQRSSLDSFNPAATLKDLSIS